MFYQLQSCTNLENLISKKEKVPSMANNISVTTRGGNRFAKLIETNNLEQISMLDHILRLFSIESKWFPSNLAFIPDL